MLPYIPKQENAKMFCRKCGRRLTEINEVSGRFDEHTGKPTHYRLYKCPEIKGIFKGGHDRYYATSSDGHKEEFTNDHSATKNTVFL